MRNAKRFPRGIAVGRSIRRIAQGLGRAPSTVSREIRRNGGSLAYLQTRLIGVPGSGRCVPSLVVWRCIDSYDGAWRRSSRCNGRRNRSPGWLKQEFPTDQDMQISHEAIYRSIFIQTRGVLKKELTAHLRTARRMRRPKGHNAKSGQGHILDMRIRICLGLPHIASVEYSVDPPIV